jgi:hypothetical protein
MNPALSKEMAQIQQNVATITAQLQQTSQLLAESLKRSPRETRPLRR